MKTTARVPKRVSVISPMSPAITFVNLVVLAELSHEEPFGEVGADEEAVVYDIGLEVDAELLMALSLSRILGWSHLAVGL